MPVKTTGQAKKLIQGWMNDRGFFDSTATPSTTPDEFIFILGGKSPKEIPFMILQPKKLRKTIVVLANVVLGKEHFDAFNAMSAEDRDEVLWDLQKDIIFAPALYSFNPEFKENGTFKGVQFTKEISYDELTIGKLGDAVIDVTRGVLWVIWTFRKKFGPLKE